MPERRWKMKVMVTGSAGLFGHALATVFGSEHTVFPLTRAMADITDAGQVRAAFAQAKPELVIHPAAIPDLDVCDADPALAYAVNVEGTRHIVEAANEINARVAYISSDSVFDGLKQTPYKESDPTDPRTLYGRTKLQGEDIVRGTEKHWIFRISVLFGPGKTNFVDKGLRAIAAGQEYVVASDQVGSATYTIDAARKIMEVIDAHCFGLFHLSNTGVCSRLELARRAAALAGLDPNKIIGKPSDAMGRRVPRMKYAVMKMEALKLAGLALPRPWEDALAEYIRGPNSANPGCRITI
ncbi:MAG TPA: NAD(P)-dependent oxidoreductase [Candidatus Dormibacteraeota bacterium]|nr:NAD(P)-dependent oxidoreductase [Candidatus Dormibacteraeota bacterium]